MILAGVFICCVYGLTSYYIGNRLLGIIHLFNSKLISTIFLSIFLFLSIILFLRFVVIFIPISKSIKHWIYEISSIYMGFFIYFLLFFIVADVIAFLIFKFEFVSCSLSIIQQSTRIIAVCLTLLLVGIGTMNANQIEIKSYDVQTQKNLKKDRHLAFISDLHLGAVGSEKRLERIVEELIKLHPDVILIGGDIFDTDFDAIQNPQQAITLFQSLTKDFQVYCCFGNHDAGNTFNQMEEFLKQSNIHCLNDETVTIHNEITLVGRIDGTPIGNQGKYTRKDTTLLLKSIESKQPILVLDHNPVHLSQYTTQVDLALFGHTHHGQIWPVNLFTAYGYQPAHNGLPQSIVTSGVGIWGMPMRIGSRCEIVSIHLK